MTLLVLKALNKAAEAQKRAWDDTAWSGAVVRGDVLENTLRELRTRADAYRSLEELTVERLTEYLELEPDAE